MIDHSAPLDGVRASTFGIYCRSFMGYVCYIALLFTAYILVTIFHELASYRWFKYPVFAVEYLLCTTYNK